MIFPDNKKDIDKAVKQDKKTYAREGFLTSSVYIPYSICMDICKLARQGKPTGSIAVEFGLYASDIMNIIALFAKYITTNTDIYMIESYGGKEYSESRNHTNDKPLVQDDLNDVLMDIALFEKGQNDERKS